MGTQNCFTMQWNVSKRTSYSNLITVAGRRPTENVKFSKNRKNEVFQRQKLYFLKHKRNLLWPWFGLRQHIIGTNLNQLSIGNFARWKHEFTISMTMTILEYTLHFISRNIILLCISRYNNVTHCFLVLLVSSDGTV